MEIERFSSDALTQKKGRSGRISSSDISHMQGTTLQGGHDPSSAISKINLSGL